MEEESAEEMVEAKELHKDVGDSQAEAVGEQWAQMKKRQASAERRRLEDQKMMMASQDLKTI